MKLSPIAININFDSLNENLGFPKNYKDPSFFEIFDRFLAKSNNHNFKYSIYIIGKDLENPDIRSRVKEWSQMGHEIGNHSYSHPLNLGALSRTEIEYEIMKSHELIHSCTGISPKGFICPGWSSSKNVFEILLQNKYLYDTSVFPSFIIYPAVLKNALNHIKKPNKMFEILNRKDYFFPFSKPLSPFYFNNKLNYVNEYEKDALLIMPLPTLNRFMFSFWHTLIFMNEGAFFKNLNTYLMRYKYFYYLMHPADLTDEDDILIDNTNTIERIKIPLRKKTELVNKVFDQIASSERKIVTMEELAKNIIEKNNLNG